MTSGDTVWGDTVTWWNGDILLKKWFSWKKKSQNWWHFGGDKKVTFFGVTFYLRNSLSIHWRCCALRKYRTAVLRLHAYWEWDMETPSAHGNYRAAAETSTWGRVERLTTNISLVYASYLSGLFFLLHLFSFRSFPEERYGRSTERKQGNIRKQKW